ncbi:hypothetical protein ALT1644_190039 [Alteromonas macleodii]
MPYINQFFDTSTKPSSSAIVGNEKGSWKYKVESSVYTNMSSEESLCCCNNVKAGIRAVRA